MKCPDHRTEMPITRTRFGLRYACTVEGCTQVCWEGPTCTPGDAETRELRRKYHLIFDRLWSGKRRKLGYQWLRKLLCLSAEKAHIGMLRKEQCRMVLESLEKESAKCNSQSSSQ